MNMSRSKLLKTGRLRDLRPNTFSWWRRARFSTSREELERNRPTSADQMSFSRSHIEQFIARFGAAGQVDRIYDSYTPLKIRVLRLQPCPRSVAHVPRPGALRDEAFQAHPARVTKDGGTVTDDRLAKLDAVTRRWVDFYQR